MKRIKFKLTQRYSATQNKTVLLEGEATKTLKERHYTIRKGTQVTLLTDVRVNQV